jgi:hypothetical protein
MSLLIGIALLVVAVLLTFTLAVSVRLFWRLTLRGPGAAEEAFERGDSLSAWWSAAQMPTTLDSPRDSERLAFGARPHAVHGEVLVEERASYPTFAR